MASCFTCSSPTVSPLQAFRARETRLAAKAALLAELEQYLANVRKRDRTLVFVCESE
jgi:hypothetical protein